MPARCKRDKINEFWKMTRGLNVTEVWGEDQTWYLVTRVAEEQLRDLRLVAVDWKEKKQTST